MWLPRDLCSGYTSPSTGSTSGGHTISSTSWCVPPGTGEVIRGSSSQTTLSECCSRKAPEEGAGSCPHPARHQHGGGQRFQVEWARAGSHDENNCLQHNPLASAALPETPNCLFLFSWNWIVSILVLVLHLLGLFWTEKAATLSQSLLTVLSLLVSLSFEVENAPHCTLTLLIGPSMVPAR